MTVLARERKGLTFAHGEVGPHDIHLRHFGERLFGIGGDEVAGAHGNHAHHAVGGAGDTGVGQFAFGVGKLGFGLRPLCGFNLDFVARELQFVVANHMTFVQFFFGLQGEFGRFFLRGGHLHIGFGHIQIGPDLHVV